MQTREGRAQCRRGKAVRSADVGRPCVVQTWEGRAYCRLLVERAARERSADFGAMAVRPISLLTVMRMYCNITLLYCSSNKNNESLNIIKRIGLIMMLNETHNAKTTPNLPTNTVDFRGFDSSTILIFRSEIPRPIKDFPESLTQAMLVGIMLVGRLGVGKNVEPVHWLQTNGVDTNGAAAEVVSFDRLGDKVRPGTFGEMKAD